jgi:Holliday junction resolvase RusA-like endonuclease
MDEKVQYLKWNITPMGKPRMTQRDKWLSPPRDVVARYWQHKDELKKQSKIDGYFVKNPLSLIFVLPMPSSWSAKKCDRMCGQPHESKPDLDNMIKAFKDSLCDNDSFVHTYGCMMKVWGYEGAILIVNNNEKDQHAQTVA